MKREMTKDEIVRELATIEMRLFAEKDVLMPKDLNRMADEIAEIKDAISWNLGDVDFLPPPSGTAPMTHGDAIRQMDDEQLVAEISRLQDIAAACPSCHKKTGVERLRLYLSSRVIE